MEGSAASDPSRLTVFRQFLCISIFPNPPSVPPHPSPFAPSFKPGAFGVWAGVGRGPPLGACPYRRPPGRLLALEVAAGAAF